MRRFYRSDPYSIAVDRAAECDHSLIQLDVDLPSPYSRIRLQLLQHIVHDLRVGFVSLALHITPQSTSLQLAVT
jgi:hypothetical protein